MQADKYQPNNNSRSVPYFVVELHEGKSKALFTVPVDSVDLVVSNPVLCCGACFHLELDKVSQLDNKELLESSEFKDIVALSSNSLVSTEYHSPRPQETAFEISKRLSARLGDPQGPTNVLAKLIC